MGAGVDRGKVHDPKTKSKEVGNNVENQKGASLLERFYRAFKSLSFLLLCLMAPHFGQGDLDGLSDPLQAGRHRNSEEQRGGRDGRFRGDRAILVVQSCLHTQL